MIEGLNKTDCTGCHACFCVCPVDAINMDTDEKGFLYPLVNKDICINCGLCQKNCPVINQIKTSNEPVAYAVYNNDEKTRVNSSSGGVFSLLAEKIIDCGGVVYGAVFDENFNVFHQRTDKKSGIEFMRTSKYVQSKIGNTYRLAKKDLDENRTVLFTGTPCQINGLLSFLDNKPYKNLYTQDIICHGVPSSKVWQKYLDYRRKKDKKTITSINFRAKAPSWKGYNINIKYDNGEYMCMRRKDYYMLPFIYNFILRDSCYDCKFRTMKRASDLTLADFWGVDKEIPELFDDKGTSFVLVNSKKGQELFDGIKSETTYIKTTPETGIKHNKPCIDSPKMPDTREDIFKNIDKMSYERLIKKYVVKYTFPLRKKLIKKIKNIIN